MKKLRCLFGFHNFTEADKIVFKEDKVETHNVVKRCKYCGKDESYGYTHIGSFEFELSNPTNDKD